MRIFVIEDEKKIAARIKFLLEQERFSVMIFNTVELAIEDKAILNADLIILDLMLPGKSGDFLVDLIRNKNVDIPILITSALYDTDTKLKLFNKGVDDYLVKPFNDCELVARVKAIHRRSLNKNSVYLNSYGSIEFHSDQREIIRDGKKILLTRTETFLLDLLLKNHGKILKSDYIVKKIWRNKDGYHSNVLQSSINRLRKKIDNGYTHKLIQSIYGVGYSIILPL